ncbi:MAG: polysaccharide pyruvyl transferase family protein [Bacilli bacterium]
MNKKIGILTWHYYENVGSNLQAYALYESIKKMGFSPMFINYQQKELHDTFIKKICKIILAKIYVCAPTIIPCKYSFKSFMFQKEYFPTTKTILNSKELDKIKDQFDIFVCGSDQIWSPIVFNSHYFLDFVKDKYKFSYAPSIGCNYIPDDLKDIYKKLLSDFNGISIREEMGRKLLEEIGIKSNVVLDPTFLLSKEDWCRISNKEITKKDYIFCYFLGENEKHRKKVYEYAKNNKKHLIIYSTFEKDNKFCDERVYKIGPKEFIAYICNADYVFTDSFHGVVFSLKFEKQFNAFYRFNENDKNNQNSRIINIINKLNLEKKLIKNEEDLDLSKIDYKKINKKLDLMIEESLNYLKGELLNGNNKQ